MDPVPALDCMFRCMQRIIDLGSSTYHPLDPPGQSLGVEYMLRSEIKQKLVLAFSARFLVIP